MGHGPHYHLFSSQPSLFPSSLSLSSRIRPARPLALQSYPYLWEDHNLELAANLSPPGHFPQPLCTDLPRVCYL